MSAPPTKRRKPASRPPRRSIPPPFHAAPAPLAPLLATLDPHLVYIAHVDAHPAWFKRRIFAVPVLLNLCIASLLAWRAVAVLPWYYGLLVSVVAPGRGAGPPAAWPELAWTVVTRAAVFLLDYVLVAIVGPWPASFFAERPANPVVWRWTLGFLDREVVVRQSRGWGARELLGGTKTGAESPFFKTRLLPAVDDERLRAKTGYLLMDRDFDLDFKGTLDAHALLKQEKLTLRDLHMRVFVFAGDESDGLWLVWDVEERPDEELSSEGTEEGRRKILAFKDKLTAMGKEELFFKWVELVQEETSKPGGFTKERQFEAGLKVQALFEEYGVSFGEFAKDAGMTEDGAQ